jgi:hypothetical protein
MRVIAFLFGLVLLLPGVCAFGFLLVGITTLPPLGSAQWRDSSIWGIIGIATIGWGFCFLISFFGIMMIRAALDRASNTPRDREPDERRSGD